MPALDEKTSRKNLLAFAREHGMEEKLLKIFNRYDTILKGCKTEEERKAVARIGIIEIHDLLDARRTGALVVDGVIVK